MKLYNSKKDKELYYYFNAKKEKLWCYRHRYYDALGKRREKYKQGFKSEDEAYRELLDVKTNILNGNLRQVEKSNLTVAEWLDIWYETHKNEWKKSTKDHRKGVIKSRIKPLIGNYKLTQLDKTTYKRVFINKLLARMEPSTVQLLHRIFKAAINAAVDDEILDRNRFTKIKIQKEKKEDRNFLTPDELNIFLPAAKKYLSITSYTLTLLLTFTGFRKGEAFGLQWNDVCFKKKTITVNRTRDIHGIRTPKSEKSYRNIKVDDVLVNQLKTYQLWCKEIKLSLGSHLNEDDIIFINRDGRPCHDYILNRAFRNLFKKIGIKEITPHGLRHTHATILIGNRVPVIEIAERLGNSPQMIYNVYGHSFDKLENESVKGFTSSVDLDAIK
ncbi:site-specific integrase [Virgibacillus pantothenticus]|uniref:Recombinase XerC n=1 Tax=Virgibacillus pantothenticus TaxID=1473 RepID=A0A0L0QV83_VIRPA|nr:site-specific integrase [Virgibacillus pantothenticus]KNE22442.1 recombinase XerC [Virgibacillus pantothenticus]MED3736313.1 tyrosine-type recombinase/integrase [Virgibacillus pantothenticus]QTY16900.1 site-specific integrase [Virgibacillus pantothenticus]SIS85641.1 Site-specific recombinase XerD [Virgibacillus pantothenticus]